MAIFFFDTFAAFVFQDSQTELLFYVPFDSRAFRDAADNRDNYI